MTRASNKKDLLQIANHGAAKGLDLSALSGLADEPDRLFGGDRPDDSFRSSLRARTIYSPSDD